MAIARGCGFEPVEHRFLFFRFDATWFLFPKDGNHYRSGDDAIFSVDEIFDPHEKNVLYERNSTLEDQWKTYTNR